MKFQDLYTICEAAFHYNDREFDEESGYKTREFFDWADEMEALTKKAVILNKELDKYKRNFDQVMDTARNKREFTHYLMVSLERLKGIVTRMQHRTTELMNKLEKEGNRRLFQNSSHYERYSQNLEKISAIITALAEIIRKGI